MFGDEASEGHELAELWVVTPGLGGEWCGPVIANLIGTDRQMKKLTQAYFLSAGMLLFVTGVLKIWSAGGDAAALQNVDGVIGVEVRHLYLLVGLVELLVVGYLLAGRRWDAKCFLLLYLGMSFASYRVLQWWLDIPEPCPCLGSATDWLGRFETSADGPGVAMVARYS